MSDTLFDPLGAPGDPLPHVRQLCWLSRVLCARAQLRALQLDHPHFFPAPHCPCLEIGIHPVSGPVRRARILLGPERAWGPAGLAAARVGRGAVTLLASGYLV